MSDETETGIVSMEEARTLVPQTDLQDVAMAPDSLEVNWDEQAQYLDVFLRVGERSWPLTRHAVSELTRKFEVHVPAMRQYADDDEIVSRMISHDVGEGRNLRVRLMPEKGTIISVHKDTDPILAPIDVFNILAEMPQIQGVTEFSTGKHDVFTGKFVTEYHIEPPRRQGDISRAGLYVSMNGGVAVAPYIYRLVCTNGMIGQDSVIDPVECETLERFRETVRTVARDIVGGGEAVLRDFVHLDDVPVERPAELIHRLSVEQHLPMYTERRIINEVPSLPENATLYDVVNLVTQHANQGNDDRVRRFAGAMMIAENRCSHCGHPLS